MKMILAGVVGGVVLFVWGFFSWVVLPIHKTTIHRFINEESVISVMRSEAPEKGVYFFPSMAQDRSNPVAEQQWEDKYRQGPIGMVMYDPVGQAPFTPLQMVNGLVIGFISSLLVAWFLTRSTALTSSYFARVAYCGMFGIFLVIASNLLMWNWFNEPSDWTIGLIVDNVIGWVLAGIGIAAFVKAPKVTTA
jgi:hypothetical protein